jgi:hypothetical protein
MESLIYLTVLAPDGINVADELSQRLNRAGTLRKGKKNYTTDIVRNVLYGRTLDYDGEVKDSLIKLIKEHKTPDQIEAHIQAEEQKLKDAGVALRTVSIKDLVA